MPHESQVVGWPGRTLFDADGSKVGKIEDVFADERTGRPAWATVSSGLFGRRHHFVPIEQAREVEDGVAVPVAGQLIKGAPNVDADGDLSRDDERTLYRHYGLDDGELDGPDAATPGATAVDADHDGRADRPEPDARDEHAGSDDRDARGYAHHDERTRHDADGDGRDDRLEGRHDADHDGRDDRFEARHDADGDGRDDRTAGRHDVDHDGRDDRTEGRGTAAGAAAAAAAAAAAHREGSHDDAHGERLSPDAGPSRPEHGGHVEEGRDRQGLGNVDDRDRGAGDDARGPGGPPTLQADATTEALARAERERLAAAEAEHDRLAARQAERPTQDPSPSPHAPGLPADYPVPSHDPALSPHEPAVLDRELAQQDLSVAPAAGDQRGHDESGFDRPAHDESRLDRPTHDESRLDRPAHDESALHRPAQGHHDRTPGSAGTDSPSVGTRLRRLARSITPSSKDDHHG